MNCPLATNYGDPIKRLRKIHEEGRSTKTLAGSVKDVAPGDCTVLGAPMLLPGLMQLFGQTRLADMLPNPVKVVISNNAGPPAPLYCAGARVTALYPVSIPAHGVGVNFTVQSYMDGLDFGVTADRASAPDMDRMGDLLVAAFEELSPAVLGEGAETPSNVASIGRARAEAAAKARAAEAEAARAKAQAEAAAKAKTDAASGPAPKPRAKASTKPRAAAATPRATASRGGKSSSET
ncbi:MAG: WS/DGAT domain-containing protein [Pseudomonadota bacterium]